jgi:hypothetical protein
MLLAPGMEHLRRRGARRDDKIDHGLNCLAREIGKAADNVASALT